MDQKLESFIATHGAKRAIEFKVAKRESGLDLMAARNIDEPRELEGDLVVKTWARSRGPMIWSYVLDGHGILWSFATFKGTLSGDGAPFCGVDNIALGTRIKVTFAKGNKKNIRCADIEPVV